jgi:hypothetical protein
MDHNGSIDGFSGKRVFPFLDNSRLLPSELILRDIPILMLS